MERVAPGDRAEFRALVDELASVEDPARRQEVERRLIQLVTTAIPQDERRRHVRLPCDLHVTIHGNGATAAGVVVDVGAGGIFVECDLPGDNGDAVDVELQRAPGSLEQSLAVKGKVVWAATNRRTGKPGLGIAFLAGEDDAERRLRGFVIELLRKRLPGG